MTWHAVNAAPGSVRELKGKWRSFPPGRNSPSLGTFDTEAEATAAFDDFLVGNRQAPTPTRRKRGGTSETHAVTRGIGRYLNEVEAGVVDGKLTVVLGAIGNGLPQRSSDPNEVERAVLQSSSNKRVRARRETLDAQPTRQTRSRNNSRCLSAPTRQTDRRVSFSSPTPRRGPPRKAWVTACSATWVCRLTFSPRRASRLPLNRERVSYVAQIAMAPHALR